MKNMKWCEVDDENWENEEEVIISTCLEGFAREVRKKMAKIISC